MPISKNTTRSAAKPCAPETANKPSGKPTASDDPFAALALTESEAKRLAALRPAAAPGKRGRTARVATGIGPDAAAVLLAATSVEAPEAQSGTIHESGLAVPLSSFVESVIRKNASAGALSIGTASPRDRTLLAAYGLHLLASGLPLNAAFNPGILGADKSVAGERLYRRGAFRFVSFDEAGNAIAASVHSTVLAAIRLEPDAQLLIRAMLAGRPDHYRDAIGKLRNCHYYQRQAEAKASKAEAE